MPGFHVLCERFLTQSKMTKNNKLKRALCLKSNVRKAASFFLHALPKIGINKVSAEFPFVLFTRLASTGLGSVLHL